MTRPAIKDLMRQAYKLLDSKAYDYASDVDFHSNFKYSETLSAPFLTPV